MNRSYNITIIRRIYLIALLFLIPNTRDQGAHLIPPETPTEFCVQPPSFLKHKAKLQFF